MNKLFCSWQKRNLTILGKILITKTLIVPIFTFVGSACIVPEKYLKEIEKSCFKFVWDNKPDKVKRNSIIGPYEKGGLDMIDIRSYFTALKAIWVKRLVNDCEGGWKIIPQHYFYNFGSNWLVFQTNSGDKPDESIEHIPDFYKDIIKCWKLTGGGLSKKPETFTDIRKQILWNNKFIKFEKLYF